MFQMIFQKAVSERLNALIPFINYLSMDIGKFCIFSIVLEFNAFYFVKFHLLQKSNEFFGLVGQMTWCSIDAEACYFDFKDVK